MTGLTRRGFLAGAPATVAAVPDTRGDPLLYFAWLEDELRRTYRLIEPRAEARIWIKWPPC